MAQPVWTLSVDLQTKTATFQSGMADAAKSARASFGEIRDSANDMGRGVGEAARSTEYSMGEARHGVMMLGETFGVHLPRGLTTFIASLGPVGAAMEAAFPFLAILLGATLLIEHIIKIGEAAEKAAEAGRKLSDDMDLGINKAKDGMIEAEIEIRKLAGEPAWDLLAEKLKLKDADQGIENVRHLEKALGELIKANGATSNWNPFNWLDHSDELANKAKTLNEAMRGKSQTDQTAVVNAELALQSKVLEQMKGQTDVSAAQLKNQQAYVGFLKQESELIQDQTDKSVLADQAKQGKDREERIKKAEEEQRKLEENQQKHLDHRFKIEAEYAKKQAEAKKKAAAEDIKLTEEEYRATEAVAKDMADQAKERAHITEELGKEEAEHTKKMAALNLQSENELTKEEIKIKRSRSQQILAEELRAEQAEYAAQHSAYQIQLASLDKSAKDHEVKEKQIGDREIELLRAHENKIAQIKGQAQTERNTRELAATRRMDDEIARGLTQSIMQHKNFGDALSSIGQQIASGMMENALKSILANDMTKPSDAAFAARQGWKAGSKFPFPVDLVMAPTLAAAAFASVMAFSEGGIVPGVGRGDVVPAMLTPGEGVIPKKLMDGLRQVAEHGGMKADTGGDRRPQAPHITMHVATKDANSFKHSQSQIHSKAFHAANTASKRNH